MLLDLLLNLPQEVLNLIASHLERADIRTLRQSSPAFYRIQNKDTENKILVAGRHSRNEFRAFISDPSNAQYTAGIKHIDLVFGIGEKPIHEFYADNPQNEPAFRDRGDICQIVRGIAALLPEINIRLFLLPSRFRKLLHTGRDKQTHFFPRVTELHMEDSGRNLYFEPGGLFSDDMEYPPVTSCLHMDPQDTQSYRPNVYENRSMFRLLFTNKNLFPHLERLIVHSSDLGGRIFTDREEEAGPPEKEFLVSKGGTIQYSNLVYKDLHMELNGVNRLSEGTRISDWPYCFRAGWGPHIKVTSFTLNNCRVRPEELLYFFVWCFAPNFAKRLTLIQDAHTSPSTTSHGHCRVARKWRKTCICPGLAKSLPLLHEASILVPTVCSGLFSSKDDNAAQLWNENPFNDAADEETVGDAKPRVAIRRIIALEGACTSSSASSSPSPDSNTNPTTNDTTPFATLLSTAHSRAISQGPSITYYIGRCGQSTASGWQEGECWRVRCDEEITRVPLGPVIEEIKKRAFEPAPLDLRARFRWKSGAEAWD